MVEEANIPGLVQARIIEARGDIKLLAIGRQFVNSGGLGSVGPIGGGHELIALPSRGRRRGIVFALLGRIFIVLSAAAVRGVFSQDASARTSNLGCRIRLLERQVR